MKNIKDYFLEGDFGSAFEKIGNEINKYSKGSANVFEKKVLDPIVNGIENLIGDVSKSKLEKKSEGYVKKFCDFAKDTFESIKKGVSKFIDSIKDVFGKISDVLSKGDIGKSVNAITSICESIGKLFNKSLENSR